MLVKVLKAFLYAHDHHNVRALQEGEIVDIDEAVLEGLHDEGFIAEASDAEIEAGQSGAVVLPAPVEIPADWQSLPWFGLQALARKLGAPANVNKVAAIALVEATLAARA